MIAQGKASPRATPWVNRPQHYQALKGRKKTPRASERKIKISYLGCHEPSPLREEVFISWQLHIKNRFRDGVHPKIDKQGVHRIKASVSQFPSAALLLHAIQIFLWRFAAYADV